MLDDEKNTFKMLGDSSTITIPQIVYVVMPI